MDAGPVALSLFIQYLSQLSHGQYLHHWSNLVAQSIPTYTPHTRAPEGN